MSEAIRNLGQTAPLIARRVIDSIQNTLLDQLFVRFVTVVVCVLNFGNFLRFGEPLQTTGLLLIALVLLVWPLAWALGALANRALPKSRNPYDLAHRTPSNGFEAWSIPPRDGLNPPPFMRALVRCLGRRPGESASVLSIALRSASALGLLLAVAMAVRSADYWNGIDPRLADPGVRNTVFIVALMALVLFNIRGWASDQRARLEPGVPEPAPKSWLGFVLLGSLVAFPVVGLTTLLHLPFWAFVVLTVVATAVVGFLTRRKARIADAQVGASAS